MADDVMSIKLISSEEIITKVKEKNEDFWVLSSPRVLVTQQMPDGSFALGMMPFMVSANNQEFSSESDVKLYVKNIMCEVLNVPDSLEKAYLEQISGIQLVK